MSQTQGAPEASGPAPSTAEKEEKFKPMRMGDPPKYPLPKIDGDPFVLLLESQLKRDSGRCEAWKDEVNNLLIFAGLFSAVVTAFIIESYKGLKQDSTEISNMLLLRILTQLEGGINGTDAVPQNLTIPTFTPTSSDVRVNILWFLSLIFSLATVLIGIIALQWLREHLGPRTELEPQIAFSLHHLNVESLDRWYLPQIFTVLPLLLQLALVLFLAGVLEFLWSLDSTVAIPIAVAVGLGLFFLLWTTVLPTAQALLLFLPRLPWGNMPRSPCPYKSPQSWAFYQSLRPLVAVFLTIFGDLDIDHPRWGFVFHNMTLEKDRGLVVPESTSSRQKRPRNLIFRSRAANSWAEVGIAWLYQRDLDFMGRDPRFTKKTSVDVAIRPVPLYDAVQAIINIAENGSSRDNLLAHHCVQPIVQCNKSDGAYMWYLSHLENRYQYLDDGRAETLSVDALMHNNMLFLHRRIGSGQVDEVQNSVVEPFVNITHTMFSSGAIRLDDIWASIWSPLNHCNLTELPDGQERLLDILQNYFHNATTYYPDATDVGSTTYFSRVGINFIRKSAIAVSEVKPISPLFSRHINLLQSLASGLRDISDDPEAGPSPDYLFFVSLAYVQWLLLHKSDTITTETGRDLILAILQYRERVIPRKDIEDGFYNSYGWVFDDDWPDFVHRARKLGIVVPSPDEELPAGLSPLKYAENQEADHPVGDAVISVLHDHDVSIPLRSSSQTDDG